MCVGGCVCVGVGECVGVLIRVRRYCIGDRVRGSGGYGERGRG